MAFTDFNSIAQVQEAFKIKYTESEYIQYADIEPSQAFWRNLNSASVTSTCLHQKHPVAKM